MLRIYARISAEVLALAGVAALESLLRVGRGVGILYLSLAALLAYLAFPRRDPAILRSVVGGMGLLFLSTGVLVALTMGVLGFPYERKGWEARLVHAALGGLRMACAVFCCPAKMNGLSPRSTRSVHLA
jgi:hypothetical protein